jgi:transcriptional regulator with XRE-family HTH domain
MRQAPHDRLALLLKTEREKAGINQREMAAKLGTNQTQVSMIESGDQHVRVIDLLNWCGVLGLDASEVVRHLQD